MSCTELTCPYHGEQNRRRHRVACQCMTEDPGDGYGERVVTHSSSCPDSPEYEEQDHGATD